MDPPSLTRPFGPLHSVLNTGSKDVASQLDCDPSVLPSFPWRNRLPKSRRMGGPNGSGAVSPRAVFSAVQPRCADASRSVCRIPPPGGAHLAELWAMCFPIWTGKICRCGLTFHFCSEPSQGPLRRACRQSVFMPPQLLLVVSNEPGTAPLISVDLAGCAGDERSLGFT